MNRKSIFEISPQMATKEAGPEPSLRDMVQHYYLSTSSFSRAVVSRMTDAYFEQLLREVTKSDRPDLDLVASLPGWIDVSVKPPRQGSYVIILTEDGAIHKAKATKEWLGGFCIGNGQSGTIPRSPVTHYMRFKKPAKCKS